MKLPLLSGKQVVAALSRLGSVEVHRKGSHVKMKHADGRVIVFPYHDEVDRFTLRGALRDADVDLEDFFKRTKQISSSAPVRHLSVCPQSLQCSWPDAQPLHVK